jgi:hypothetical protein
MTSSLPACSTLGDLCAAALAIVATELNHWSSLQLTMEFRPAASMMPGAANKFAGTLPTQHEQ